MADYGTYEVSTDPAAEPVSTADAKEHLRIESGVTADDGLVDALVASARAWVEQYLDKKLISQTITQTLDDWPGQVDASRWPSEGRISDYVGSPVGAVELLANPVSSITSVTVYDDAGGSSVWSSSKYRLAKGTRARLALVDGESWPSATRNSDAIEIVYVAGYGAAGSDVPKPIVQAVKQLVAYLYENRGEDGGDMPPHVAMLLKPYRFLSL